MSNLATNTISILGGAAVGAIALYLFDPDHGPARRSSIANTANDAVATAGNTVRSSAGSAKKVVGEMSDYAQQLAEQVKSHAASAARQAHSGADQAHQELHSSIGSLISKAKDYAAHLSDRGQSAADDLSDRAKSSLRRQTGWEPVGTSSPSAVGLTTGTIATLALGAGAMFFFDPARGRSRRAWASDKLNSWFSHSAKSATSYGRHVGNQIKGAVHDVKHSVPQEWTQAVDRAKDAAVSAVSHGAPAAEAK